MDEVFVEREGDTLLMKCRRGNDVYSVMVDNSLFTGRVWDYFNMGPILVGDPKEILVLGLGGGTIIRQFLGLFDAHIDVVEINPLVVELAERYFDVRESERLSIMDSDAFEYMKNTSKNYDVIAVDVFEGDAIPKKLTEPEFMELIRSHTNERAVVVVNTITTGRLLETSDRILENARKVFPSVSTIDDEGNRLVIALSFKADCGYAIRQLESFENPIFDEVRKRLKTKVREHEK